MESLSYSQLAQDLTLPEHKRYEYLVAAKLDMLIWNDAKDEVCANFGIPETRDYGIDLISRDFTKVAQVKCHNNTRIGWSNVATFLAYNLSIIKAQPILVTTPNTPISDMVIRTIPDIVYISKSGIIEDRSYYIEEVVKIFENAKIGELSKMLKLLSDYVSDEPTKIQGRPNSKREKTNISKDRTSEWVKNNPPLVAIPRKEYYDKYVADSNGLFSPLNMIHFGRILNKTLGFDNITSPSINGNLCYLYTPEQ